MHKNSCELENSGGALYSWGIVVACLVTSTVEPLAAKFAYTKGLNALQLLVAKFIIAGLILIPVFIKYPAPKLKDAKRLIGLSLLFMSLSALIFISLRYLPATVVITVMTTTPAIVAIINQAKGRERNGVQFWAGFLLCFTGIIMSLKFGATGPHLGLSGIFGLVCIFVSIFLSAIYRTSLDEFTHEFPPVLVSIYLFVVSGAVSLFFVPVYINMPAIGWLFGGIIAVAAILANVTFLEAIKCFGSTRMSIISLIQRPVVIFLAAMFLSEPMTYLQVAGIVLVLVGIYASKETRLEEVPEGEV